jgi:hypothetical protein
MKAHVNIFPTPATKFPTKESSQEIRKEILACKNSCKEKLRNFELQKYFLGMETPTRNQNFHFQNMAGLAANFDKVSFYFGCCLLAATVYSNINKINYCLLQSCQNDA